MGHMKIYFKSKSTFFPLYEFPGINMDFFFFLKLMELFCTILILSTEYQRDRIYTGSLSEPGFYVRPMKSIWLLKSFNQL